MSVFSWITQAAALFFLGFAQRWFFLSSCRGPHRSGYPSVGRSVAIDDDVQSTSHRSGYRRKLELPAPEQRLRQYAQGNQPGEAPVQRPFSPVEDEEKEGLERLRKKGRKHHTKAFRSCVHNGIRRSPSVRSSSESSSLFERKLTDWFAAQNVRDVGEQWAHRVGVRAGEARAPYARCPPDPGFKIRWLYVHVFKSGGTSVVRNCGENTEKRVVDRLKRFHIDHDISKLRLVAPSAKLFTFVREPVEHFLSGFKECEYRQKPEDIFLPRKSGAAARSEKNSEKYGPEKIRAWVKRVTTCFQYRGEEWNEGLPAAQQLPDAECKCTSHSYVQAASLPSSMDFVGDLSPENMEKFFRQEALPWGDSVRDRHDKGKIKHDIQLDKETLLAVCEYVAVDYCMFDFAVPKPCEKIVQERCRQIGCG